jgi:hypothetical protein
MRYVSDMRLGLRQKLVLGGLAIVVVVSFGFTLLQLTLTRKARAVFFAREVATSIGDRSERPFLAIGSSFASVVPLAAGESGTARFRIQVEPRG